MQRHTHCCDRNIEFSPVTTDTNPTREDFLRLSRSLNPHSSTPDPSTAVVQLRCNQEVQSMHHSLTEYDSSSQLLLDTVHLTSRDFDATNVIDHNWDALAYSQRTRPVPTSLYPTGNYTDPSTGVHILLQRKRLSIQFSAPRVIHGNNAQPIINSDLENIRHHIDRACRHVGLQLSTDTLVPTRVDLFDDFQLDFSVQAAIAELWRLSSFDRLKLAFESTAFDYSYVRWANGNRQVAVYDKSRETKRKCISVSPNTLRFEYRLMNTDTCARAGFDTFGSLSNQGLQRAVFDRARCAMVAEADAQLLSTDKTAGEFIDRLTAVALASRASELPSLVAGALAGDRLLEAFGGIHGINRYVDLLDLESHKRASVRKQIARILNYHDRTTCGRRIWDVLRSESSQRGPE